MQNNPHTEPNRNFHRAALWLRVFGATMSQGGVAGTAPGSAGLRGPGRGGDERGEPARGDGPAAFRAGAREAVPPPPRGASVVYY